MPAVLFPCQSEAWCSRITGNKVTHNVVILVFGYVLGLWSSYGDGMHRFLHRIVFYICES